MIVYQTDQNGYYLHETIADESPLEPGVWLIPGGCVEEKPPKLSDRQKARWSGSQWDIETEPEPEPEPEPTPEELYIKQKIVLKEKRDLGLESITVIVNNKEIQVRPQDALNIQTAISLAQDQKWILSDNTVQILTPEELQEALQKGIIEAKRIWDDYADSLEQLNQQ